MRKLISSINESISFESKHGIAPWGLMTTYMIFLIIAISVISDNIYKGEPTHFTSLFIFVPCTIIASYSLAIIAYRSMINQGSLRREVAPLVHLALLALIFNWYSTIGSVSHFAFPIFGTMFFGYISGFGVFLYNSFFSKGK